MSLDTTPWSSHMRLGINHHLLYPQAFTDIDEHVRSLKEVLRYPEFEVVDMFIPDERVCGIEAALVEESGKEVVYNCPLMNTAWFNPHAYDPGVRERTLNEALAHVDRARLLGARKLVVASGVDPGEAHRSDQTALFADYLLALCRAAGSDMEVLVEPFDRSIGKHLMIGSSPEAARLVAEVQSRGGDNIGILADMGHIPLMKETFEFALRACAPYIRHIHLGSCVKDDPADPLYGDMHPPWGYPGGAHDVPELTRFLRELREIGYLGGSVRPTVTLEMRPYPAATERDSVDIFLRKLYEAWETIV